MATDSAETLFGVVSVRTDCYTPYYNGALVTTIGLL